MNFWKVFGFEKIKQLRRQTTLTVGWIAGRLQMGSRGYAGQLLWRATHQKKGA